MSTKAWFRTHSFTGIITGLLLFVICFSGTFAVFAHELDWLVTPGARVQAGDETVSWGTIQAAAQAQYPEAEVASMMAPLNRYAAATVNMRTEDRASLRVWVDPYTGQVTGSQNHSYGVHRFFRNFHRFLFLPGVGLYLVCLFAVTMLVSVVAALFFYKRWWTRFFQLRLSRGRALWSELHKFVGLWSLWFCLLIIVTGLWYLFEAARMDFVDSKANYVGSERFAVVTVPEPTSDVSQAEKPLDELLMTAQSQWPAFRVQQIGYGWFSDHEEVIYFGGQDRFPLVRPRANQMQLDTRSGEVLWQNAAGDLPLYWLWSNMADPLHFGDFAGWISKTIWFVFGLLLSGLILTGTWLHAHRLAGKARDRHRWPGTVASIVVTGVVLAASGVFGLRDAYYYGVVVNGARQLPDLGFGVAAVIIGWIVLTLAILVLWTVLLWRPGWVLSAKSSDHRKRQGRKKQSAGLTAHADQA